MANHSGIMIFRVLSCLLAHHQRLTTIFISVLERNPGYDSLYTVSQIISREMSHTPKDIAPNHIHLLKYAPVTSCEVERSFSLYKNILSDRRQNLTSENMEKYLVTYCASCHDWLKRLYPNLMRHYCICICNMCKIVHFRLHKSIFKTFSKFICNFDTTYLVHILRYFITYLCTYFIE